MITLGAGDCHLQTLLTCVLLVQAAPFVQQAWRCRSVCFGRLLIDDAAFDSASTLSSVESLSTRLNDWETRQCRPALLVDGGVFPLDHRTDFCLSTPLEDLVTTNRSLAHGKASGLSTHFGLYPWSTCGISLMDKVRNKPSGNLNKLLCVS